MCRKSGPAVSGRLMVAEGHRPDYIKDIKFSFHE